MRPFFLPLPLLLTLGFAAPAQTLTGPQAIQKSIAYHDPRGQWAKLKTRLYFTSTNAAGKESPFEIELDNTTGYFCHISHPAGHEVVKAVVDGQEVFMVDGKREVSAADRKQYRLADGAATGTRDFYTYLYGLPMKLQDAGAIIAPATKPASLLGQEYTTAEVRYDPAVGTDSWTFYFDPATYALRAYRFHHNRTPNDGEYITLSDMLPVNGLQLPKERKWYLNKDDSFLATDRLLRAEPLAKRRA